jgi:hypothetical protein
MSEFLWVCSVRTGARLVGFQNVALWLAKSITKKGDLYIMFGTSSGSGESSVRHMILLRELETPRSKIDVDSKTKLK